MDSALRFRFAEEADIPEIIRLIRELAIYEKSEEAAKATPELLAEWMFEKRAAEALLVEHEGTGIVGCAIFFQNFSTWTGKAGMYMEDLYIEEAYRGSGTGRALLAELSRICGERGWVRLDWACLDWNTPSLGFYKSIGAEAMTDWVHHRLSGESLHALAHEAGAL